MIKLNEDDILWKGYCKFFDVANCELELPKSLCGYFWTAIIGFALAALTAIPTWLSGLALIALAVIPNFLDQTLVNDNISWLSGLLILLCFGVIVRVLLDHKPTKANLIAQYILEVFAVASLLGAFVYIGTEEGIEKTALWAGATTLAGLALVALVSSVCFIVTAVWYIITAPAIMKRFFAQVVLYAKACKDRLCPLVIAPDGYVQQQMFSERNKE